MRAQNGNIVRPIKYFRKVANSSNDYVWFFGSYEQLIICGSKISYWEHSLFPANSTNYNVKRVPKCLYPSCMSNEVVFKIDIQNSFAMWYENHAHQQINQFFCTRAISCLLFTKLSGKRSWGWISINISAVLTLLFYNLWGQDKVDETFGVNNEFLDSRAPTARLTLMDQMN